jgi:NADH-quinone oxidoreductase subunit K
MIPQLQNYLIVGAILFVLGMIGFMTRRNLIVMFLSAEMMLQGVSINLVAFSRYHESYQGQSFTIFILTVAACEAAVALALIVTLYQRRRTLDVSVWQDLREAGQPPVVDQPDFGAPPSPEPAMPQLTPAGREPAQAKEESHV